MGTARAISAARRLNPDVHIVARVRYVRDMTRLYQLGANVVVSEEVEASIRIFSQVLSFYGVSDEMIEEFGGTPGAATPTPDHSPRVAASLSRAGAKCV